MSLKIFKRRLQSILELEMTQSIDQYYYVWFETCLGEMLIVANDVHLVLVDFVDQKKLEKKLIKLKDLTKARMILGDTPITLSIKKELTAYFNHTLTKFETPLLFMGTDFQKKTWHILQKIPFGTTRSYLDQAHLMKMPKAFRAVANANGANPFTIVVPCHRIINQNGDLGGYGGGFERKKWLLAHEANTGYK